MHTCIGIGQKDDAFAPAQDRYQGYVRHRGSWVIPNQLPASHPSRADTHHSHPYPYLDLGSDYDHTRDQATAEYLL
jgi:hypothetical protein